MRPLPLLFIAASGLVSAAFAADSDAPQLPPPSDKTGLTYDADIRPIFEANCFRCHGEQKHKGEIRLDSLAGVLKGGEDGKIVVPGKSAESAIVLAIARVNPKTAMPPIRKGGSQGGGPAGAPPPALPLTPEQVGLVRAWIDQGAK